MGQHLLLKANTCLVGLKLNDPASGGFTFVAFGAISAAPAALIQLRRLRTTLTAFWHSRTAFFRKSQQKTDNFAAPYHSSAPRERVSRDAHIIRRLRVA